MPLEAAPLSPETVAIARAHQRRERTIAIVQMLVECTPDELDCVIRVIDHIIDNGQPSLIKPQSDAAAIAELRLLLGERLKPN